MDHQYFMRRAIALALNVPEFPFGALIVHRKTREVMAEGFNQSALNPPFMAKWWRLIVAPNCTILKTGANSICTRPLSHAPCVQSAIEWAGIASVYYGTSITYLQKRIWWQINIRASEISAQTAYRNSRIMGGVLEAECNALFDNAPRGIFHKDT